MPAVLQSTIDLLESELVKARAALEEIQPDSTPMMMLGDDVTAGAMAAYRKNLIGRAPDFFYGTRRLTPKDIGLEPVVREVASDESDEDVEEQQPVVTVLPPQRPTLLDMLSNSLILDHMAPYLSVSSLFALARTSRSMRSVIMNTPYIFRHLDLSRCRGAQLPRMGAVDNGGQVWRNEQMDESLTEDEFYSGPLRGIFCNLERRSILQSVRTLVLDGLSVPADLVADIILTDRFNVNILSIRECLHLNERKLMQVLQHAVRPTRSSGMPRVKGIYYFTPVTERSGTSRRKYRDWWSSKLGNSKTACQASSCNTANHKPAAREPDHCHSLNAWYRPSGKLLKNTIEEGWAQTLQKCEGIIAFDAVLCRGPRHNVDLYSSANANGPRPEGGLLPPAVATIALGPGGCDGCRSSPEGPAVWGQSPDGHFPLLSPPPLHSSKVSEAKNPYPSGDGHPVLIARCEEWIVGNADQLARVASLNASVPAKDARGNTASSTMRAALRQCATGVIPAHVN
ncbi:hypothetical protein VTN00DRAFT_10408 [Thermoascus crustaceus]|uniref:uncharacterized protein n=1 Tax=Thermoascus crustaceus TaxID=5088 RepID=UPI0037421540